MALKAISASRKIAGNGLGRAAQRRSSIAKETRAEREAAQAAEFSRLVSGFEARIRDIDHALESVLKQLAG